MAWILKAGDEVSYLEMVWIGDGKGRAKGMVKMTILDGGNGCIAACGYGYVWVHADHGWLHAPQFIMQQF